METEGNLRQRTRELMRQEVAATALKLFLERGFEPVTTVEIAHEAGISPRSFFRYFPTKEDVVLSGLREGGEHVRDGLRARPKDEPVWESLRIAFRQLIDAPGFRTNDLLGVTEMIMSSPSIQARNMQKRREWEDILLPEIALRLPERDGLSELNDEDRARALLAAGLGCVDAATRAWLRFRGTTPASDLLDGLMSQIRVV